jgi:hypothetical protein
MSKKNTPKKTKRGFLYFAGPKPVPADAPNADTRVHRLLRKRESGTTLREIVRRLRMPASTADWARIRLMKVGAMIRKRQIA